MRITRLYTGTLSYTRLCYSYKISFYNDAEGYNVELMGARKRICGVEGRSREKRSLIEVASALGGAVVSAPRLHALLEGSLPCPSHTGRGFFPAQLGSGSRT
jgi:hypothetical protein